MWDDLWGKGSLLLCISVVLVFELGMICFLIFFSLLPVSFVMNLPVFTIPGRTFEICNEKIHNLK